MEFFLRRKGFPMKTAPKPRKKKVPLTHKNGAYQERIKGIYRFLEENLYFNRPDMEIDGEKYNTALLFGILTALNRGKELIIGEPGVGKTTSAEFVGSLIYQIPVGVIWGSEVPGHPEQTEEKIVGRPDLGKLNAGVEKVVWSHFSQIPVKIVDEINRLPETKQSMILDGVDRGNWEYLNEMIINEEYCLFATANYQDQGTNTIIPPMIDRFDVLVESRHPGPNISYLVGKHWDKEHVLRHPQLERDLQEVLNGKAPYHAKHDQVEAVCDRFGEFLGSQLSVKPLTHEDRQAIFSQIRQTEFSLDASAFTRTVLAELSFCYHHGQKRSVEQCPEGCHYTGYLCHEIKNCSSNRLPMSIRSYSQVLAWLMEDEEVDIEHVKTVIPHTLAHRIQWRDEHMARLEKSRRKDPFMIFLAKEASKEILRRYDEQRDRIKEALGIGFRILQGEQLEPVDGDHPVYAEIKKDLSMELS
jgi:MoxR-like ATPase